MPITDEFFFLCGLEGDDAETLLFLDAAAAEAGGLNRAAALPKVPAALPKDAEAGDELELGNVAGDEVALAGDDVALDAA